MSSLVVIVVLVGACIFSSRGTWLVRSWAMRHHLVDIPGEPRKTHARPTPLGGGLAIFLAFAIGAFAMWPFLTHGYLLPKHLMGVLIAGLILTVGGLADDRWNLSPAKQIFFPMLAAVIVIAAGIGITTITNPFGEAWQLDLWQFPLAQWHGVPYHLTLPADVFTFAWLLGMMYTTKFLDGVDGLVSGMTVISAGILAVLSLTAMVGQPETAVLAALVASVFLGFLPWNWHPAKIFLGEGGSVLAGFLLGVIAIISGGKIATALLIFSIPILDAVWVITRRMLIERRSPFRADRRHLHQRLLDIGLSHRQTVIFFYLLTFTIGVTSLTLQSREKVAALGGMVMVMALLGLLVVRVIRKRRS